MSADSDQGRQPTDPDSELKRLASDLGDHYLWIPTVLARAGGWRWLIPWPFLALGHRVGLSKSKEHGSAWLTAVTAASILLGAERLEALSDSFAADAAKTIYTAAFLVITMLSLSVALPGQAIIKLVLGSTPLFATEFVAPTLWAFLWGMIGGTSMVFYARCGPIFRIIASVVALYAFAMAINAVLYTIRVYLLGLVLTARKARQEHAKGEPCSSGPNCS